MLTLPRFQHLRPLYLLLLLSLASCTASNDDDASIENTIEDWDQYIGLYQTAAVAVATGEHFPSDNKQIRHVYSHAGRLSKTNAYVFAWTWTWQGSDVYYFAGIIDDAPTDILVKSTDNLTPQEILALLVDENDGEALGVYGEDYFWNVFRQIDLPFPDDLLYWRERIPDPQHNAVINLATYTDTSNCTLFWIKGQPQGWSTTQWKNEVKQLRQLINDNDLAAFNIELAHLKSNRCSTDYYRYIFDHILAHEQKHFANNTRATFLDALLNADEDIDISDWDHYNNLCNVIAKGVLIPSSPAIKHKPVTISSVNASTELTKILLKHGNFENKQCDLWHTIERLSYFDDIKLLEVALDIELQHPFEEEFGSSHTRALRKSAENGNFDATAALFKTLPKNGIDSKGALLSAAAKGGNTNIMDLVSTLDAEFTSTEYFCFEALLASLNTGSVKNFESLLSQGCSVPTEEFKIEDFFIAAFTYRPESQKNYLALYNRLQQSGLTLNKLSKAKLFYVNTKALESQVLWDKIMDDDQQPENKLRFDEAFKTLIDDSVPLLGDINAMFSDKTLLMRAAKTTNVAAVKHLLTHKPSINVQNDEKVTALDLAYLKAEELHESRQEIWDKNALEGFKKRKKWRERSLEVIRLLSGDTSLLDVYVY